MIEIKFDLKDMHGVSLNIGDTVKVYFDEVFTKKGKIIKSRAKTKFNIGTIHWHNGSGGMWPNGVVVNRESAGKFEAICVINPNSKDHGKTDYDANVCWYIEKI